MDDGQKCATCRESQALLRKKDSRINALEEELKEAKKSNMDLTEILKNITAKEKSKEKDVDAENVLLCKVEERVLQVLKKNCITGKEIAQSSKRNAAKTAKVSTLITEKGGERGSKEDEEIKEKLNAVLIGNLNVLKDRVMIQNARIFFDSCDNVNRMTLSDFLKIIAGFSKKNGETDVSYALKCIQNPMWILCSQKYEIECQACEMLITLEDARFGEERLSICCRECSQWTIIGLPKEGNTWNLVFPCEHFQQVPEDEELDKCEFCSKDAEQIDDGWEECVRVPETKENA